MNANPEMAARLMRRASIASVAVAGFLIVIKVGAWIATDSVALLSSLVDSLLDMAASLINLFAIHHALTPPDREHRFGHGKAESLAALGQAAFISASALFLVYEAGTRLISPREISHGAVGIGVIALSIAITLALVRYQASVVRRTGSVAIKADSLHYRTDLLVNVGVIVSLIGSSQFGWTLLDPLVALAIAFYIVFSAWKIVRGAIDVLMDREFSLDERERILSIARAHSQVKGVHDLRTRTSGIRPFIQFHLELDGDMTLHDAHIISDQVEADVMGAFPRAEVIIHQDPDDIVEARSPVLD